MRYLTFATVAVASCSICETTLPDPCASQPFWARLRRGLRRWVADPLTADQDLEPDDLVRPINAVLDEEVPVAEGINGAGEFCDVAGTRATELFALLALPHETFMQAVTEEPWRVLRAWDHVRQSNWSQLVRAGWPLFGLLEMVRQKQGGAVWTLLDMRAETLVTTAAAQLQNDASMWGVIAAGLAQSVGHCNSIDDAVLRAQEVSMRETKLPQGVLLPGFAALELACAPQDGSCAARQPRPCLRKPTIGTIADMPWFNLLSEQASTSSALTIIGPIPNSVLPSEAFAAVTAALAFGVDLVIESGVGNGGSLTFWCAAGLDVVAVDMEFRPSAIERAAACGRAQLFSGDGFELVPRLVAENLNRSLMVFLDGPKGCVAVRLASELLRHPHVQLVAIHDVHLLSPRYHEGCGVHVARGELERMARGDWLFTSDSQWFVDQFGQQFDGHWDWKDRSADAHGSYGPTIGLWSRRSPAFHKL